MDTLSQEINKNILSYTAHPYLGYYINRPVADDSKVVLLELILKQNADVTDQQTVKYITATMLLQIALDTHDGVTKHTSKDEEEAELRNRQLTVLSGDYYSGLYYHILAELGEITLIKKLAEGIKRINEEKIILGQGKFHFESEILETLAKIEASLLFKVAEFSGEDRYNQLVETTLVLRRLRKELTDYRKGIPSLAFSALAPIMFKKNLSDLTHEESIELIAHVESRIESFRTTSRELLMSATEEDRDLAERLERRLDFSGDALYSLVEEG
ncbi:MAG: heptaprenyl diphosphate synthase component 1 [Bacillus sp. (in: firmicutes)]